MQDQTIQERFDELRRAWIDDNPVSLSGDPEIEEVVRRFAEGLNADESYDSEGSENRVNPKE